MPPARVFDDRALYERMFRAEPRKHVSRSNFLTVMRRVYGFRIAPLTGHVDHAALRILGEVRRSRFREPMDTLRGGVVITSVAVQRWAPEKVPRLQNLSAGPAFGLAARNLNAGSPLPPLCSPEQGRV